MERTDQLKNVAFGGAWSEQISGHEALRHAIGVLSRAPERSADEDLRSDKALLAALNTAVAAHPKGQMLRLAWDRALGLRHPDLRRVELVRISEAIRTGLGKRLDP